MSPMQNTFRMTHQQIKVNASRLITNTREAEFCIHKKVTFAGATLCDVGSAIYGPSIENYYTNKYVLRRGVKAT